MHRTFRTVHKNRSAVLKMISVDGQVDFDFVNNLPEAIPEHDRLVSSSIVLRTRHAQLGQFDEFARLMLVFERSGHGAKPCQHCSCFRTEPWLRAPQSSVTIVIVSSNSPTQHATVLTCGTRLLWQGKRCCWSWCKRCWRYCWSWCCRCCCGVCCCYC